MECMKCGQETTGSQVFCDECLEVMSRYPVNSDAPVQILPRSPKDKSAKKWEYSPEELLQRQKRISRRLYLLVWILGICLAAAVGALLYLLYPQLITPQPF